MTPTREEMLSLLLCPSCGSPLRVRGEHGECDRHGVRVRLVASRRGTASDTADLISPSGEELVLKVARESHRLPEEATPLGEAVTLHRLARLLGPGSYRVPEVVPGAALGAILMRRVSGRQLEHVLGSRDAWLRPSGVRHPFELAGRWLGALATVTGSAAASFSAESVLTPARAFLRELRERGFPREQGERMSAVLAATAAEVSGAPLARCLVHGDFRPSHAFVDGEVVTVLDFEQAAEGWAHEDAAFFLAALDTFAARHPVLRFSPGLRAARRGFLAGYLANGPSGWDRFSRFLLAAATVRSLLIEYRSDLRRRRPMVFARVVIPYYERRLEALSSRSRRTRP